MPNEVEFQHQIIKAVKKQGGHGGKWASQFQVGKPDLLLQIPTVGFVVMEVKLEKAPKGAEIRRSIGITDLQRIELKAWRRAGALSVIGVVFDRGARDRRLVVLPPDTEVYQSDLLPPLGVQGNMPYGGHVDMVSLMDTYKRGLDGAWSKLVSSD